MWKEEINEVIMQHIWKKRKIAKKKARGRKVERTQEKKERKKEIY